MKAKLYCIFFALLSCIFFQPSWAAPLPSKITHAVPVVSQKPLIFVAPLMFSCNDSLTQAACKQTKTAWQAFAQQLSHGIHQPVHVVFAPSEQQAGLILSKGAADLGYVTQMPFDKLRQQRPVGLWLEPIAIATEADGSSRYHAIFLTQPGKKVGVQNLKGEKLGFIEQSVSGSYLPQAFLQQQGLYNADYVVMYQTPYAALLALAQHQILGVFMADMVWQAPAYQALFAGKFQQSFMLIPALPSPLLVVNSHTVTPKIIKAIKRVLPTLSIQDGALHSFQVCDAASCPTLRTLLLKKITVQE